MAELPFETSDRSRGKVYIESQWIRWFLFYHRKGKEYKIRL